ncbi:MAG: hypothetical protein IID48_14780 [Proteobacteria bacterium]|nr:hypothetical protein [Pseudomonadota bacterium]
MVEKLPYLPDEHHYAIAAVAARAAQLDHHIEHAISCCLIDHPKTAEFALKNLSADRVVGLLKAVLLDMPPRNPEKIEDLISKIMKLRSERNELLHWLWGKSDEADKAAYSSIRPFREKQTKEKTAAEIQEIAEGMLACAVALARLPETLS